MTAFLAGVGITLVLLIILFSTVIVFAGIIATIRAAINGDMGNGAKVFWILGNLFIPGVAFLYFAFVDKNLFLKLTGWICIIAVALTLALGGSAVWGGIEGVKRDPAFRNWTFDWKSLPPPESQDPENKDGSGDETSIEL
ncbi:MAG: hypothetical protein DI586_08205 [Micavibrio aeruginosavorus]|uniref:Uncharacterized protein n=1 Tax=Micavibrio aeruginosavorus TaxID=349221 RepID=A0A2W5HMG8_9BACT|nr:MAG: hypothetical protein DI586_08205 [Micavibrio aeruginosavorus]